MVNARKLLKKGKKKLNCLLWKGSDHTTAGANKVSWDLVCKPKNGRFTVKDIGAEEQSVYYGVLLSLFAQAGSLWVAWVHSNLLKNKCFWVVKIAQDRLEEYSRT